MEGSENSSWSRAVWCTRVKKGRNSKLLGYNSNISLGGGEEAETG